MAFFVVKNKHEHNKSMLQQQITTPKIGQGRTNSLLLSLSSITHQIIIIPYFSESTRYEGSAVN